MKLSIVIPNYNGASLLKKNVPKIKESIEQEEKSTEIIVVDDNSKDNSLEVLSKLGVKVVKNSKNLGFSSSVNRGVAAAKGDLVVLLNTDVWPEKNFLKELEARFRDRDVFAVGFLDKSIENDKTVLRGRGIGSWEKGFLVHRKGEINKDNTLWASGGSAAFRKTLWKKLGGLDEIFNPFYWEDIDLSYRALKSGFIIIFAKDISVYHEHSKGSIKSNYSDTQIKTIAYRNQFIFAWKNATDLSLQIIQFIFFPYHISKALIRRDWAFLLGLIKALIKLPKIVKSSLKAQEQFVKSDKQVVREFKE